MGCMGCELYRRYWPPDKQRCYAANLIKRYAGQKGWPASFDEPELFPERIPKACRWKDLTGTARPDKPWLDGKPRIVFVNDLSDSWTGKIPNDWMLPYIPMMAESPHIWLHLTKRPGRMARFFFKYVERIPDNFVLGTTITKMGKHPQRRLYDLFSITRSTKLLSEGLCDYWLSLEPMVGPIDLDTLSRYAFELTWAEWSKVVHEWGGSIFVACGGESGPNKRLFNPDWARRVRDQCQEAGVRFFMKQVDKKTPIPGDLLIREIPEWRTKSPLI